MSCNLKDHGSCQTVFLSDPVFWPRHMSAEHIHQPTFSDLVLGATLSVCRRFTYKTLPIIRVFYMHIPMDYFYEVARAAPRCDDWGGGTRTV